MGIFDERERAFENKWAREADQRVRVRARRNHLLADWAAAKVGLTGEAASDCVLSLMKHDYEPRGEESFFAAIADLTGIEQEAVREKADEFQAQADRDIAV